MTDTEILRKALERYRAATGENAVFKDNVIVFLEKEIDRYREKIESMEQHIESMGEKNQRLKIRLNAIYGVQTAGAVTEQLEEWKKETEQRVKIIDEFSESIAQAVQELANKHDALTGRIEQLGQMVENKMDQVLGDGVQTLTTFTEERTSEGGTMTLATHTKYEEVQDILLRNGYFVTSHFDDDNTEDETITIEFWRG